MRLLDQHVTTSAEGHAVYADGWSDSRVAEEANVQVNTVAYSRVRLKGKLRPPRAEKASDVEILALLQGILEKLDRIEVGLDELRDMLDSDLEAYERAAGQLELLLGAPEGNPS
jgi:hypothetical protein